jgi:hypothetical protein
MAGVYFVLYPGELTPQDRAALNRPGFKVYENGIGLIEAYFVDNPPAGGPEVASHQVVRLRAESAADASRQVIDALGRQPDGLRARGPE